MVQYVNVGNQENLSDLDFSFRMKTKLAKITVGHTFANIGTT